MSSKQRIALFLRFWLPLIGYLGAIFFFSHLSDPTPGLDLPVNDKIVHFLEYFPLPLLFFRAFRNAAPQVVKRKYILYGILCAILYAVSDEIHQSVIVMRDASLFDLSADVGGIMLGAFVMKGFAR